jgi:hypothetical protein
MESEDFLVKDLPDRYSVGRTWLYKTYLSAMKKTWLGKPAKRGNQAFVTPEQLKFLDGLDIAIKNDRVDEFLHRWGVSELSTGQSEQLANLDPQTAILTIASAVLTLRQADSLAHIRVLQEACDRGWLLSTSDLAPLLKLARLSGAAIERYGFSCVRVGRNGSESAWRITQADLYRLKR